MVTCVCVPRQKAESTRQELSDIDAVSDEYQIVSENGMVYIPVTRNVDGFEVTDFDSPPRDNYESVEEVLGYSPTYEWVGDIVILKEDENLEEIVSAFSESSMSPTAILDKTTKIKGEVRTPEYNILYGDTTETVHTEYGYEYLLDVMSVYFTPRLSTERKRFMDYLNPTDRTLDMFCGVGPYTIPSANLGSESVGVDINPDAVEYLKRNARRNGVADSLEVINSDVRDVCCQYRGWADNVVMNLPHTASDFMREAEIVSRDEARIFLYDFVSNSKSESEQERYVADLLSDNVRAEDFSITYVRPYAPGISNVCIEFSLYK